jgi:hypothetical protein
MACLSYLRLSTCSKKATNLPHAHTQARCYLFDGKPASEQRSDFPPLGAPGVSWHVLDDMHMTQPVSEQDGRKTLNLWGDTRCKPLQLSECPMRCSNRGSCIKVRV